MNKQVIEEAEKLIDEHRPYAITWDCYNDEPLNDESPIKASLVSVELVLTALENDKIIYGSDYRYEESTKWQQVKEYLENKLKQL